MKILSRLRNRETGRRAFVLANGPSILGCDLARLQDQLVIGMNASTLLEAEHGFRSAYYTVSDRRFLNHPNKRSLATSRLDPATVRIVRADLAADDDPSKAARTAYVRPLGRDGFSFDIRSGFYYASTTTLLAFQLPAHLGCRDIALLGCDFTYPADQPRFYEEAEPCAEDPVLSVQVRNIANAARTLKARGINLVSCSERSMLRPYVPYAPFDSLFQGA
jgi:hypothetical protein